MALEAFRHWLRSVDPNPEPHLDLNAFVQRSGLQGDDDAVRWRRFLEDTQMGFSQQPPASRTFNQHFTPIQFHGSGEKHTHASQLEFAGLAKPVELRDLRIRKLAFIDCAGPASVTLTGLCVDKLTISHRTRSGFELTDCWIGTLSVSSDCGLSSFKVRGGAILGIQCPPPKQNPFAGSVHFASDVFFPRDESHSVGRLEGPQPYRNMRDHMLVLQNTPMVNLFFTLEQATERRLDHRRSLARLISWAYEFLSDYGSSVSRPLWLLAGLFIASFIIVLGQDGAVVVGPAKLAGWQSTLNEPGFAAYCLRTLVLTGYATLNPLSIFGVHGPVVAKYTGVAAWLWLNSVASALLWALFFLAVRRRFKMT